MNACGQPKGYVMIFVYLDESGSAYSNYLSYYEQYLCKSEEKKPGTNRPYPLFILAALALDECQIPVVDEWFDGIKRNFLGSPGFAAGQEHEIKGSILYALREGREPYEWEPDRKGRKRPYTDAQKRIWSRLSKSQLKELETSLFDLLRRVSPTIWVVVVDQPRIFDKHKEKTWPPLYWALTYLQQRLVHHVQAKYGAYQQALFLMDKTSHLSSAAHFETFLDVREKINRTAVWPVDFRRWLLDVPLAGQSHLHQALQLVDVVAHATGRLVTKRDPLGWFDRVKPFLARHWSTSECENAGLTFIR